ncbi:hypothetical protein ACFXP3_10425 [Streptomyces sp. NPDC059096]|uniref:hypothetical protein n=1 Tax=Streptomyces sp. NPDC059096 TaxID=3346727 RepID=UPI00369AEB4B
MAYEDCTYHGIQDGTENPRSDGGLCDQWRLRRGVILRWSLAWYLQRGITDLPAALTDLPPLQSQT